MEHDIIIRERGTDREVRRIHYGSISTANSFGRRVLIDTYPDETHVRDVVPCLGPSSHSASTNEEKK